MENNASMEFRNKQKAEALSRMKMLRFHPNVIREFDEEDKLNLSEFNGALFWLDEQEKQMVKEFEENFGGLVYHVLKNNTEIGLMYSFLYVSKYSSEWEMDNADLQEGCPVVYVKNMEDDFCSEFGRIGIMPFIGGVVRTA